MPDARWCMICGSHEKTELTKEGTDLWLCEECGGMRWAEVMMLVFRKREVEMLKLVVRGLAELGVAVDAVLKEKRRPRVHYKVPGCKAHVPDGG